jgi:hypothetical protein
VPRITDFCIWLYVFGCKLSLFRLCDSDFGIAAVDDISVGVTCTAFCFHIAHISFAISWYLFCLSVIVLTRLYVFGIAMSIKKLFFVFFFFFSFFFFFFFFFLLLLLLLLTAIELSLGGRTTLTWVLKK